MSNALLWNQEAEYSFVSAVITTPEHLDKYPLLPSELTDSEASTCLRIALELRAAGKEVTGLTVRSEATKQNSTLGPLAPFWDAPATHPASTYRVLCELATARRIRAVAQGAVLAAENLRVEEAVVIMSDLLAEVERKSQTKSETSFDSAMRIYEQMKEGKSQKLIPTGIVKIDNMIGGLGAGSLSFIGADTGVGKSSLSLFMADAMSKKGARPGLVTCEDGPDVLGVRIVSLYSGVNGLSLRRGEYAGSFEAVTTAMERIKRNPIDIAYEIGSDDLEVVRAMTSLVKDKGCNVIFVDYIQTINSSGKEQDRRNEMRRIGSRLKQAAYRLGVPIIVASQITVDTKGDGFRIPTKHDLKECKDLANMAEFVFMLWRDQNTEDIHGKMDKSKVGADGTRFRFVRDGSGTLREVDERY